MFIIYCLYLISYPITCISQYDHQTGDVCTKSGLQVEYCSSPIKNCSLTYKLPKIPLHELLLLRTKSLFDVLKITNI